MEEEPQDVDRWIAITCMERLVNAPRQGLSEAVLVATVGHRASEAIGFVAPATVRRTLRRLQDEGRVEHSAGRWRRLR